MRCPNDQATLVMSDRSGVEIDYCPECRGVWLDRGELDKIIDRAGGQGAGGLVPGQGAPMQGAPPVPGVAPVAAPGYGGQHGAPGMAVPRGGYASPGSPGSPASWDRGGRYGQHGQYGSGQYGSGQQGQYGHGSRRRKGNWLSELFD